jgi:hypothetical protein
MSIVLLTNQEIFERLLYTLGGAAAIFMMFRAVLPTIIRVRGMNWPKATATIQRTAVSLINAPGVYGRIIFCGYEFTVEGVRYFSLFAILANLNEQERLKHKLYGAHIQIRYNPSHPETSFLVNLRDPLFDGYLASQDRNWLSKAPVWGIETPTL